MGLRFKVRIENVQNALRTRFLSGLLYPSWAIEMRLYGLPST
jgi:hypothetical protein